MFTAHVEETVEAAHSNGPPLHKCHNMHGHSWRIEATWKHTDTDLDDYGWGPDFGAVKSIIRRLDHSGGDRGLNALFSFAPSAENIARWLFDEIRAGWHMHHLIVIVHEGKGNSVQYDQEES